MNHQQNEKGKIKKSEHIANIIANLVFLWILYRVPSWNLDFLKGDYIVLLMIMQINCFVQIAASVLLLLVEIRFARLIVKIIAEIAGFVPLIMLYYLYPFDFSNYHNMGWLDTVLPIIFILAMVVTAIKVFTMILKLFFTNDEINRRLTIK
jgi:hypothetical protein